MSGSRATVSSLSALAMLAAMAACAGTAPESAPAPEPSLGEVDEVIEVRLEPLVEGLDVPNDVARLPDGRLLISDQVGRLHLVAGGELAAEPVLDLTGRVYPPSTDGGTELELGLSGVATHPDVADNGRVYLLYTEPPADDAGPGVARVDVLAEFTLAGDPLRAVPDSERVLLRVEQPSTLHVGGHLAFGPDGLLYLGMGDAGREANGQDPSTLAGTIIRIDVDGGEPYAVPGDNPFVDGGGAPEVFAYGLRNPFRVNWLDGVGLLIAEPQWNSKHQEVHVAVAGANYGWPAVGRTLPDGSCYPGPDTAQPLPECLALADGEPLEPPVIEYGPQVGRIVSGVVPYAGSTVPALAGQVVVSDWQGAMLAATPGRPGEQWPTRPLAVRLPHDRPFTGYLWALDHDADGEVLVLTASRSFGAGRGVVYRMVSPGH